MALEIDLFSLENNFLYTTSLNQIKVRIGLFLVISLFEALINVG